MPFWGYSSYKERHSLRRAYRTALLQYLTGHARALIGLWINIFLHNVNNEVGTMFYYHHSNRLLNYDVFCCVNTACWKLQVQRKLRCTPCGVQAANVVGTSYPPHRPVAPPMLKTLSESCIRSTEYLCLFDWLIDWLIEWVNEQDCQALLKAKNLPRVAPVSSIQKHSKNFTSPWPLTYDIDVQQAFRGCQYCSCKTSSSQVQRFMSCRVHREEN